MTFKEASILFKKQWEHYKSNTEYLAWRKAWSNFNNHNRIDEKDGCYMKTGGELRQVLIIDRNGVVTSVIANENNQKSACFRHSYLNIKFPKPPFSPAYILMRMK